MSDYEKIAVKYLNALLVKESSATADSKNYAGLCQSLKDDEGTPSELQKEIEKLKLLFTPVEATAADSTATSTPDASKQEHIRRYVALKAINDVLKNPQNYGIKAEEVEDLKNLYNKDSLSTEEENQKKTLENKFLHHHYLIAEQNTFAEKQKAYLVTELGKLEEEQSRFLDKAKAFEEEHEKDKIPRQVIIDLLENQLDPPSPVKLKEDSPEYIATQQLLSKLNPGGVLFPKRTLTEEEFTEARSCLANCYKSRILSYALESASILGLPDEVVAEYNSLKASASSLNESQSARVTALENYFIHRAIEYNESQISNSAAKKNVNTSGLEDLHKKKKDEQLDAELPRLRELYGHRQFRDLQVEIGDLPNELAAEFVGTDAEGAKNNIIPDKFAKVIWNKTIETLNKNEKIALLVEHERLVHIAYALNNRDAVIQDAAAVARYNYLLKLNQPFFDGERIALEEHFIGLAIKHKKTLQATAREGVSAAPPRPATPAIPLAPPTIPQSPVSATPPISYASTAGSISADVIGLYKAYALEKIRLHSMPLYRSQESLARLRVENVDKTTRGQNFYNEQMIKIDKQSSSRASATSAPLGSPPSPPNTTHLPFDQNHDLCEFVQRNADKLPDGLMKNDKGMVIGFVCNNEVYNARGVRVSKEKISALANTDDTITEQEALSVYSDKIKATPAKPGEVPTPMTAPR